MKACPDCLAALRTTGALDVPALLREARARQATGGPLTLCAECRAGTRGADAPAGVGIDQAVAGAMSAPVPYLQWVLAFDPATGTTWYQVKLRSRAAFGSFPQDTPSATAQAAIQGAMRAAGIPVPDGFAVVLPTAAVPFSSGAIPADALPTPEGGPSERKHRRALLAIGLGAALLLGLIVAWLKFNPPRREALP